MTTEQMARKGIELFLSGDAAGWRLLWDASQEWRRSGDVARADVAEAEARRLRFNQATRGFLDLYATVRALGLGE